MNCVFNALDLIPIYKSVDLLTLNSRIHTSNITHVNNMHYKCANLMFCRNVVKIFTTPHYDILNLLKCVRQNIKLAHL